MEVCRNFAAGRGGYSQTWVPPPVAVKCSERNAKNLSIVALSAPYNFYKFHLNHLHYKSSEIYKDKCDKKILFWKCLRGKCRCNSPALPMVLLQGMFYDTYEISKRFISQNFCTGRFSRLFWQFLVGQDSECPTTVYLEKIKQSRTGILEFDGRICNVEVQNTG